MTPGRAARRAAGGLAVALLTALGPGPAAQDVPRDLRPFVKLGYEFNVEIYRDPVARWNATTRKWEVEDLGVLVQTRAEKRTIHGSGTVVTPDGLILTNYHVFDDVLRPERRLVVVVNERNEVPEVHVETPKGSEMLVFEVPASDPFSPPAEKYRARGVAWHPVLDIAVLKISAFADGTPFSATNLPFMPLGNPYALEPLSPLHIFGYPGKGGQSLTQTTIQFSGYTKDAAGAIDGSLKAVATIAGGNSGGSALFRGKLVGIPTRVSSMDPAVTDPRGAPFGYFHPVTWAARPFAVAQLLRGYHPPALDRTWVDDPHNTDPTRGHIVLGGRVVSATTQQPIPGALVIVQPADRTLTIEERTALVKRAGRMAMESGRAPDLTSEPIADDKGAFALSFYRVPPEADANGFFVVTAPRKARLKIVVEANGFRSGSDAYTSGDGLFADVGQIKLVPPLVPLDPGRLPRGLSSRPGALGAGPWKDRPAPSPEDR